MAEPAERLFSGTGYLQSVLRTAKIAGSGSRASFSMPDAS
jgi:hypothetical protein